MTQGTFYLSLSHCHDPHHPSFRSASCPYEDPLSPPDPQFLPLNPPEPHRHTTCCPTPANALSDYRPGKNYLIIGSKKGWCGFLSAPDWMNSYGDQSPLWSAFRRQRDLGTPLAQAGRHNCAFDNEQNNSNITFGNAAGNIDKWGESWSNITRSIQTFIPPSENHLWQLTTKPTTWFPNNHSDPSKEWHM